MEAYTIRRVPWTCEWGRFGLAVEDFGAGKTRVDDVFWACHNPRRSVGVRMTQRGECEECPYWIEATRLRAQRG